ncbi:ATPase, V0 complex, subunit E1/e2 [Mycena amicta]|nr:ATPase, V0 complex, subunit E1/e2 [Mycena amicta]
MSTILPIFFLLAIVAGLMTCAALFTPKGPNQVVIRTAIMLALAACYLMWMVTYLAQLHPLLQPVRTVAKVE